MFDAVVPVARTLDGQIGRMLPEGTLWYVWDAATPLALSMCTTTLPPVPINKHRGTYSKSLLLSAVISILLVHGEFISCRYFSRGFAYLRLALAMTQR